MKARYWPCFSVNCAGIFWTGPLGRDPSKMEGTSMNVRYIVALEIVERQQLEALAAGGICAVRRVKRAQILLAADAGRTDEQIANTVQVSTTTVYRTKRRFVEDGMEHALSEDPRSRG